MKKRILLWIMLFGIIFVCFGGFTVQAASFSPRTSAPSSSDYHYYSDNIFYQSGYGMPNCTAYAWGRAYELLGTKPSLCTGNAGQWYSYNKSHGYYSYGSEPKLGAIACWDHYDNNTGHVAVVEAISGNNVTISESNYGGVNWRRVTIPKNGSYDSSLRFLGYIYIGNWDGDEQPVNLGDSFYAYIINTAAWKHLTYDNDWNITSRTETGKANQIWYFSKQSDNSYKITSVKDGRCMEVHDFGKEAGTNVHMNDYSGNSAQLWYVYGKSGAYKLRAKCTDCVLDLADNSSAEGANIQMWTSNDTPAQKFQIWKLSLPTIPKPTLKVAIDNNYINNAVFSWEPVDNAHYYDLRIMENGNIIKTIWATKDTYYNVNLPAGNYTANVAGINDNFRNYTFSNTISFSIPNSDRPTTDFNVIYENSQSIVRNNTDHQRSVVVIIARYMNGTIKDINIKNEIFAARETKTYSHGANARVFVWDSLTDMKPLTW